MLRRAWRRRHSISPSTSLVAVALGRLTRRCRRSGRRSTRAPALPSRPPIDAGRTRRGRPTSRCYAAQGNRRRTRVCSAAPARSVRAVRQTRTCARGPDTDRAGASAASKWPERSVTPNVVLEPIAETTAPATAAPPSSCTKPSMARPDSDATRATGAQCLRSDRRAEHTENHQNADRRGDQSGCVSHGSPRRPRGAAARYPAVTVKLMSRVSDLFASLSVTLISSR